MERSTIASSRRNWVSVLMVDMLVSSTVIACERNVLVVDYYERKVQGRIVGPMTFKYFL